MTSTRMEKKVDSHQLLQALAPALEQRSGIEPSELFSQAVMDEIRRTGLDRTVLVQDAYLGRFVWLSASGGVAVAILLFAVVTMSFGIDIDLMAFDSFEVLPFAL